MTTSTEQARWDRLAALFDELIDAPPGTRATRLAELAAAEPALAAELAVMLSGDAADGPLDHTLPDPGAPAEPVDDGPDRSGQRIGPYRLLRPLGRGGMGEVWLGERAGEDFQQRVAVKLLKRGMDSDALLRRFAQERRILAQLEHPNIARLLDGGIAEDGTPYFAMEFVDGSSVTEHARARELDPRQRVRLLLQAADAVAHAQARLVVHRDLKPSNIMVDGDGDGRVRVLDFGIAKLLDDSVDEKLTGTGVNVLSPAYAAPEQVRGEPVTTATDVYALGGVLFELLTGRLPHPGRGASPAAWLRSLESESAERPSAALRRSGAEEVSGEYGTSGRERIARELRGDLDTIVVTALHGDPRRRYVGASELAQDLRSYLDGRPIAARPDTAGYRMRKFIARHRFGVGSASAVLLALIAGLGITLWQADVARRHAARADAEAVRAQEQATRADAEAQRALDQAARADQVKQFLSSVFLQVDPLRRDAQGERTLAQAFDEAVARIDVEFANDPVTRIDLLDDFGEIRAGQGDFDASQALFERALALAESTYPADHPAVAESLLNLGVLASYRGNHVEGEAPLRRAVAILEAQRETHPQQLAAAQSGLAGVLHSQGRRDEAVPLLRSIVELRRTRDPDNRRGLAIDLQNLATALLEAGEFEEAAPLIADAMAMIEQLHGADSVAMIPVLWLQEELDYRQGDTAREAQTVQRQVELARQHIPGDHWWKARALAEHGWILAREGDRAGGRAALEEAMAIYQRLDSPMVTEATRRIGQAEQLAGDWVAARTWFQRTVDTCAATPERGTPTCLVAGANLAEAMAHTGDGAAALAAVDTVATAIAAQKGDDSDEYAQALAARAAALQALGRGADARAVREQRLQVLQDLYGPEHPLVRSVRAGLDAEPAR